MLLKRVPNRVCANARVTAAPSGLTQIKPAGLFHAIHPQSQLDQPKGGNRWSEEAAQDSMPTVRRDGRQVQPARQRAASGETCCFQDCRPDILSRSAGMIARALDGAAAPYEIRPRGSLVTGDRPRTLRHGKPLIHPLQPVGPDAVTEDVNPGSLTGLRCCRSSPPRAAERRRARPRRRLSSPDFLRRRLALPTGSR